MKGKAVPAVKRRRKGADKPAMPAALEPIAAKAKARHRKRHANPGVVIEVEKLSTDAYVIASPHRDHDSWLAMLCEALGTRSEATAKVFAHQLTKLCSQNWHPEPDGGGEWCPDETELNMILNFVAGVKPRNEMQAALAAQMCAIHMLTMKAAGVALEGYSFLDPRTTAITGKLAKTFALQMDTMAKLQGKKTTRQKITVKYERHEHQHVHFEGGGPENGGRALEPCDSRNSGNKQAGPDEGCPALPGPDAPGVVVPMPRQQGQEALPHTWRGKRLGRSEG